MTATQVIDLDAPPSVLFDYSVAEHVKGGRFEWDPKKIRLHLSNKQKRPGRGYVGHELHEELAALSPYNANLRDFLLREENQHLIPKKWKDVGCVIAFWGTIYRTPDGGNLVPCMGWMGGSIGWYREERSLGLEWKHSRAAVPRQ